MTFAPQVASDGAPPPAPPVAEAAGKAAHRREPAVTTRQRAIAAIRAFLSSHSTAVGQLTAATFEITTFAQAEKLATMLAMQYPDPDRAALGIWELFANAIEHGSLGIGFEEKAELLRAGAYEDELKHRLDDPVYAARTVTVAFRRGRRSLMLTVTDQGAGFDHSRFLTPRDDLRTPNGRGIRIARDLSFDALRYVGAGNRVVARTLLPR